MLEALVGMLGEQGARLVVGSIRRLGLAYRPQGNSEVQEQFDAVAVVRAEPDRPPQERCSSVGIATLERRAPGRGDVQQGTFCKKLRIPESVAELDAIPVGLLKVVADDKVELAWIDGRPVALQPPREALVEVGPVALG